MSKHRCSECGIFIDEEEMQRYKGTFSYKEMWLCEDCHNTRLVVKLEISDYDKHDHFHFTVDRKGLKWCVEGDMLKELFFALDEIKATIEQSLKEKCGTTYGNMVMKGGKSTRIKAKE